MSPVKTRSDEITKADIVRKIKGLLSRAKGSNFEGEVAASLNLARTLLAKYNMSMAEIEMEADKAAKPEFNEAGAASGRWQPWIAMTISKYCGCETFLKGGKITFIGMHHELEICTYTFGIVCKQVERMISRTRRAMRKERKREGKASANPRETGFYIRGYVLGINDYLKNSLLTQQKQENSKALVPIGDPRVAEWMKRNVRTARVGRRLSASDQGRAHGYSDGRQITLTGAISHNSTKKVRG